MIIGIGTDILNLERLQKIINKYDQKFIDRIYGKNEIQFSKNKLNNSINYFGKRFSAKEGTPKSTVIDFNPTESNAFTPITKISAVAVASLYPINSAPA